MNIRNESPELLSVGWVGGPVLPGEPSTTFFVKATLGVVPGGVAKLREQTPPETICGEVYEDDDANGPLRYPGDFALFKPRADVLVVGSAYAPDGKATVTQATIQVGTLVKTIMVVGDREWQASGLLRRKTPSEARPFEVMPLSYRRAHGGPDFPLNPVGRGHKTDGLPNFELPGRMIASVSDKTAPAGFGPISAQWRERASLTGTYHDKWAAERWPCPPRDFDFAYYNAAPKDQQVEGYLRGDEALRFQNLHSEHEDLTTELPALRARCFLNRAIDDKTHFAEVELKLDTLWVDLDADLIVLTWRGRAPVRSSQMTDVLDVFVCVEPLDQARADDAAYAQRMRRVDEDEAEEEEPEDEGPTIDEQSAELTADLEASRVELAAIEAEADAAEHAVIAQLASADVGDPAALLAKIPDFAAELNTRLATESDPAIAERIRSQLAAFGEADSEIAEVDKHFDQLEAEFEQNSERPLTREEVVARLAAQGSFVDDELSDLDLSGLDFSGVDLSRADLSGASLNAAVFRDATLVGSTLTDADLTAADFRGAELSKADLTGSTVVGIRLAGAKLHDADLSGLDLSGADLSSVEGERANFGAAVLAAARFDDAVLPRVDFISADLQGASFVGATLTNADLHEANARGAKFTNATLDEARASMAADFSDCDFGGVSARDSVWEVCELGGADLSGSNFSLAQFTGSRMAGVRANRTDLREAVFDDASLEGGSFIYANFLRASFVNCKLAKANLSGANLFGAGLVDADVEGLVVEGANLKRTLLEKRT